MEDDAANVPAGKFVMIASDTQDPDNSKMYVKNSEGTFTYLNDLSGAQGIQGPTGPTGDTGDTGAEDEEASSFFPPQAQSARAVTAARKIMPSRFFIFFLRYCPYLTAVSAAVFLFSVFL